jgi:3alpha(or 20beta)-hydroxysteroid dehydrogenase
VRGRLSGKVALITGAASGMGAATATAFVNEGAQVVIADVNDAGGVALSDALGRAAIFIHLDVTDPAQWASAVQTSQGEFGKLNVLVNNAGIFTTGGLADYPLDTWDRTLAINLTGAFLGLQASLIALVDAEPASVINVSSTAGIEGYPGCAGYSASKWGLRGLTRSAALELAGSGVRVNSVHPGAVATPLLEQVSPLGDDAFSGSTLERPGRPDEVSGLMVYLASDESTFCTGSEFVVDGGITAGSMH